MHCLVPLDPFYLIFLLRFLYSLSLPRIISFFSLSLSNILFLSIALSLSPSLSLSLFSLSISLFLSHFMYYFFSLSLPQMRRGWETSFNKISLTKNITNSEHSFLMMGRSQPLFSFIFVFANLQLVDKLFNETWCNDGMGIEPRTSGVGSDRTRKKAANGRVHFVESLQLLS